MALLVILLSGLLWPAVATAQAEPPVIPVAVVGGLQLSGVWPHLAELAEQDLGVRIDTRLAAPKEQVVPEFRSGQAHLLLIHGGHHAFELQAQGYADPLRIWAYNEHVFVGPKHDPARVAQAGSARDAMARIQNQASPFLAFWDPGSHSLVQPLWRQLRIPGDADWVIADGTEVPQQIVRQAAHHQAYVVVGHIPVAFGKMPLNQQKVLFSGDPQMRRPYVVLTPGPRHPASEYARQQARLLASYLLSEQGQAALLQTQSGSEQLWLYPLATPDGATP